MYRLSAQVATLGDAITVLHTGPQVQPDLSPAEVVETVVLHARRQRHMRLLLDACQPREWVRAAQVHMADVRAGRGPRVDERDLLQHVLPGFGWLLGNTLLHPCDVSVKKAAQLLELQVTEQRCVRHRAFIADACAQEAGAEQPALEGLQRTFARVWREVPVRNEFKELLWRMAVDGVAGAQKDLQGWMRGACGCSSHAHADLRVHHFWSCPVAQAVVAEMSRVLQVDVQRRHIWLLERPEEVGPILCPWHIWAAACLASLYAMNTGRRRITALRLTYPELPAGWFADARHRQWVREGSAAAVVAFWKCLAHMGADLQAMRDAARHGEGWAVAFDRLDWGGHNTPFICFAAGRFRLHGQPADLAA